MAERRGQAQDLPYRLPGPPSTRPDARPFTRDVGAPLVGALLMDARLVDTLPMDTRLMGAQLVGGWPKEEGRHKTCPYRLPGPPSTRPDARPFTRDVGAPLVGALLMDAQWTPG
jgi:hypothetical protein